MKYNPRGPDGEYDCTGMIGELFPSEKRAEWPMFSYSRPGSILWNAIASGLAAKGWTDERIREWLQSKSTRHALDGELGDMIEKIGKEFAATLTY
jgi:hypothetical protein